MEHEGRRRQDRVGIELLHRSYQLGVSQRWAEWFVRWTADLASAPAVHVASFQEGLGRIMFVAGALEFERPDQEPLHKCLTLHPRRAVVFSSHPGSLFCSHYEAPPFRLRHGAPASSGYAKGRRASEFDTDRCFAALDADGKIDLVYPRGTRRTLSLCVRRGHQTLTDYFDAGSTRSSCGTPVVSRRFSG